MDHSLVQLSEIMSHALWGHPRPMGRVESSDTHEQYEKFPYDPAILLLVIYPDKTLIQKGASSQQHNSQQPRRGSRLRAH